jgi:hypothetical protein
LRTISDKQGLTLKAATRRAVDMAGGGDAFQHVTRIRAAQLSKCGSTGADNAATFLPIDVAVEADMEAGSPIILSAMAEALGYQVVPLAQVINVEVKPVSERDALRVAREAADVVNAIVTAIEDGAIDSSEERDITREIDQLKAVLVDVMRRASVRARAQ